MGLKLKAPKIKIKAPKIKVEPAKLIKNYAEGVGNAAGDVIGGIAKPVVGSVGETLATPGSAELLGGVGAAFGVPTMGLGTSANSLINRKADFDAPTMSAAPAADFSGGSSNMIYYIIAGVIAFGGILFLVLKRK